MSHSSTNLIASYNKLLKSNPLLIKVLTGATLSGVNEVVSSSLTGKVRLNVLLQKIMLMVFYGGAINTPINHFGYKFLIKFVSKFVSLFKQRGRNVSQRTTNFLQLLGSLFVISPIQVCFLIMTLTVVNSPLINEGGNVLDLIQSIRKDYKKFVLQMRESINDKFNKFYTSSFISSTIFVTMAQNFIHPEKWAIFFSCAYTTLNTSQNIYLKLKENSITKDST